MDQLVELTLYSRPGCHLCDEMKAVIAHVRAGRPIPVTLQEVDVSTDHEVVPRTSSEFYLA